ncbi:hypothetical protein DER44DRAFT_844821 [Fusarium oxysporum]|nr:hypothetical protein DER44DRAFT_844821 [Fusarium oxysporum]KAH7460132.1 hypothetical protein FOMA001_g19658 [Fusarium oxysporum f. sp. matthiolae]
MSQNLSPAAQEDGPVTVTINSIPKLKQLLRDLDGLPNKPPSIYLDTSVVGQDQLAGLQVLVLPTNTLYFINLKRLGTSAVSTLGDNDASLCSILESKTINKVGFDIRHVSRLLVHQLNVSLDGMWDIQLLELASRDDGQSKKFLAGFTKCIEQLPSSNSAKARWLKPDDSTNLHFFNSLGHVPRQSMKRVEMFPSLWSVYRRRLGTPNNMVWLHFARQESQQRAQDSKDGIGRHERQDLGPEIWWDYELRQAAIDAWNDFILDDVVFGDFKLNEDADFVLK